jgi:hypothetical protein
MKQEMKDKRDNLKELSKVVKMAISQGIYNSVNEGLVDMYAKEGHTEIHSFNSWLTRGYAVRKGEKALLLWGEPRKGGKQEKEESDDEYNFFPLAYVFSQKQVEPIKQNADPIS